MIRIASLVLILSGLAALSGCSIFGIATKGELEKAMEHEAAQQQAMEARLAELDSALAASEENLAAATRQWVELQDALVTHIDSLRTEFVTLDRDMALVRQGFDTVSAQATQAQLDSRRAMQIHHETLVEQRERLLRQIEALDERLQTWSVPVDTLAS